ncbi:hypothetical protein [Myceligenerans salitolerans]|uniref:Uncharacterized protein n=1 Tax=Myceligenerans salitolerans TaxID=1230528 RepID=A0ABS3ICR7_9MICO|nr:hypothetical protein [Myceligenerans salitolerans]MBO0609842.1 hypothetical protein [Myceligenerans salitolerans]
MRIKSSTRPAAGLAALALTSAAVVAVGGAAQAAPAAHRVASQTANPVEVTIEWGDARAFAGGISGVPGSGTDWFMPITANVYPASAEGTVRFVATATADGEVSDLGAQPVTDGRSVAPTWALPGGPVVDGTPRARTYTITAEFVPDDPATHQGAVPTRDSFLLFQLATDPRS